MELKYSSPKVIDIRDVGMLLQEYLGMTFCTGGYWNAKGPSFEFDLTDLREHPGYCAGESKFVVVDFSLDPPCNKTDWKDWIIPIAPESFIAECMNQHAMNHDLYAVTLQFAMELLVRIGVLEREEVILKFKW